MDREREMRPSRRDGEHGFSLIELMVAMTITLVISGAVYGLMATGQNAFRREPELAERQQNIRMAMDIILRDIGNAGSGMPTFTQTFTPGLNDCAACPMGLDGANRTDELQILTNAGLRDNEGVCRVANGDRGDDSHTLQLVRGVSNIAPNTTLVLMMDDGTWTVRHVTAVGNGNVPADNCTAANHVLLTFADGGGGTPQEMNVAGNLCAPSLPNFMFAPMGNAVAPCDVMEVAYAEVVRYRTQVGPDGAPILQRATSAAPGFQTIARGIDDFQVQYITAGLDPTVAANWVDNAPVVGLPEAVGPPGANPWPTIITQVRVTLSARSEAQNISGARNVTFGPAALRGSLTATASPRSSLMALTRQPVPAPPAAPPHLWR